MEDKFVAPQENVANVESENLKNIEESLENEQDLVEIASFLENSMSVEGKDFERVEEEIHGEISVVDDDRMLNSEESAQSKESNDEILQPNEDLPHLGLSYLGIIKSIINGHLVVHSSRECVLQENGHVYNDNINLLGKIELIFGPVKAPCYYIAQQGSEITPTIDSKIYYKESEIVLMNIEEIKQATKPIDGVVSLDGDDEDLADEEEKIAKLLPQQRSRDSESESEEEDEPKEKLPKIEDDLLNELFEIPKSLD